MTFGNVRCTPSGAVRIDRSLRPTFQHDDDFGLPRPDLAEIAFRMAPPFGE